MSCAAGKGPWSGVGPDNRLHIFHPILDPHLSMRETTKKVIFDNLGYRLNGSGTFPTPRTPLARPARSSANN